MSCPAMVVASVGAAGALGAGGVTRGVAVSHMALLLAEIAGGT